MNPWAPSPKVTIYDPQTTSSEELLRPSSEATEQHVSEVDSLEMTITGCGNVPTVSRTVLDRKKDNRILSHGRAKRRSRK